MISKIFSFFGYMIQKKKKMQSLEAHLSIILNKLNINLVLDVGANTGQFGSFLRSIGYKGQIMSFEPCEESFTQLKEISKKDLKWAVNKQALGESKSQKKINIFNSSDLNSFLEVTDFGNKRFSERIKKNKTELVEVTTLNEILKNSEFKNKNIFLKMDTQGFDLNVFRGANKNYHKILGLMSEIPIQNLYKSTKNYHGVLQEYENNGFQITGMFPVSQNKDNNTIIEFDTVMIRI